MFASCAASLWRGQSDRCRHLDQLLVPVLAVFALAARLGLSGSRGIAERGLGAAESWCQLDHTAWITALAAHVLRLLPPRGATKLELAWSRDRVSTKTLDHV